MKKYNDYQTYGKNPFISQDYKYSNPTGTGYSMRISNDYGRGDRMAKSMQFPQLTNLNDMRDNYIETISQHIGLTKVARNLLSYLITYAVGFHEDSPLFTLRKRRRVALEKITKTIENSWIEQDQNYLVPLDQDDFNLKFGYRNRFSVLNGIRELLEKKVMVRAQKSKYGSLKEYFLHPAIFDNRNLGYISVKHTTHSPSEEELLEDVERLKKEVEKKTDLLTNLPLDPNSLM